MADEQPGHGNPPTPATGDKPPDNKPGTGADDLTKLFVSKEDFGKTAGHIRGLGEKLNALAASALTADKLVEILALEKDEATGKFRLPKAPDPPANGTPPRGEDDPVMKRVKALEQQVADKNKEIADERARAEATTRDTALISALQKAGAINPNRDFVHLRDKVAKGDKGYTAKTVDEYGAEHDSDLDAFAEQYLKQNPELKKATQQGGSGTPPGPGSKPGMRPGSTVIPKSQWGDVQFMVDNRKKFESGEYLRGE